MYRSLLDNNRQKKDLKDNWKYSDKTNRNNMQDTKDEIALNMILDKDRQIKTLF